MDSAMGKEACGVYAYELILIEMCYEFYRPYIIYPLSFKVCIRSVFYL